MNENFKLSRSAQNDLESVHIGPWSVPAKFQLSMVSWRGIMGLIHSPNSGPQSVRDFCISLGTVNQRMNGSIRRCKTGSWWLVWTMPKTQRLLRRPGVVLVHGMNGMNKNSKSSQSARNDMESFYNLPRSVSAEFQLSRLSWRDIRDLINCPQTDTKISDTLEQNWDNVSDPQLPSRTPQTTKTWQEHSQDRYEPIPGHFGPI